MWANSLHCLSSCYGGFYLPFIAESRFPRPSPSLCPVLCQRSAHSRLAPWHEAGRRLPGPPLQAPRADHLVVACEPYFVPHSPNWVGDNNEDVAVLSRGCSGPPLSALERGNGYVVVGWRDFAIIGIYFSPNRGLAEFELFLDSVSAAVRRQSPRKIVVLGDFNAKSRTWGNPATNARGAAVEQWSLLSGLSLLNRGTVHTCVRHRGGSVVDLTFASPAIAREVNDWRVEEGVETLSDHRYVRFEISALRGPPEPRRGRRGRLPKWAIGQLDLEMARESAIAQRWGRTGQLSTDMEGLAGQMRSALEAICDAAMPRARRRPLRRQVYWWSPEIANLRVASNRARRAYVRCRQRVDRDDVLEGQLREEYKTRKKSLQLAISQAKERAREELLAGLDRDPWGRPYQRARNKLRACGAPIIESMDSGFLLGIMGELFPRSMGHVPPRMVPRSVMEVETTIPPITDREMEAALSRLHENETKRKAPGPDGVPGLVLGIAAEYLKGELRELLNMCLRSGQFPKQWKVGRLCLLRKEGRPVDSPSAYRPLVLLDETAKLFEKVLVDRLVQHLEEVGPGLSGCQYGFRSGRSTIGALAALKSLATEAVAQKEVLLAVSLDIKNAFNSIPHETLKEALRYHGVPPYLRRLLEAYLEERHVLWEGGDGRIHRHRVECGVPQGSVLGPALWNVGFDWLLRGRLLPGMGVICYADDTLVTARRPDFRGAARLAEEGVALVVGRIGMLGLRVSAEKTEALLFHGPGRGPPRGAHIGVSGVAVPVRAQMRYLGLHLDSRWNFGPHFAQLVPRLVKTAAALGRLLPNTGGPGSSCRRLYAGVVRSMALYGAPIWAESLTARNRALLRRPQRVMAVRAIRGYRTVSWTAATLLAGDPPWSLVAEALAEAYRIRVAARADGERVSIRGPGRALEVARRGVIQRWREELESPVAGRGTVEAVAPHFHRWINRRHGSLSFRVAQVLTGHGVFGKYLHRIGREEAPGCHECGAPVDDARHTLEVCPAWGPQRHVLSAVIGGDLSLSTVISKMLDSDGCWSSMASFCEEVISTKEAAERGREAIASANSLRRRRPGRRRRRYAHLLPPP